MKIYFWGFLIGSSLILAACGKDDRTASSPNSVNAPPPPTIPAPQQPVPQPQQPVQPLPPTTGGNNPCDYGGYYNGGCNDGCDGGYDYYAYNDYNNYNYKVKVKYKYKYKSW